MGDILVMLLVHELLVDLVDGKKVESGWNISEAKNVGRANATTIDYSSRSQRLNLSGILKQRKNTLKTLKM